MSEASSPMKSKKATPKKKRRAPQSKPAKRRRAKATARVYAQKFREDPRQALKSVVDCLMAGDIRSFKEQVRAQYESLNTAEILKQAGLSKATFYEALSAKGNPGLQTIAKILDGLRKRVRA